MTDRYSQMNEEGFNPSWVPPAGLMYYPAEAWNWEELFQSLMGATGRSN